MATATPLMHPTTRNESNGPLWGRAGEVDGASLDVPTKLSTNNFCRFGNTAIVDTNVESPHHRDWRWRAIILLPSSGETHFSTSSGTSMPTIHNVVSELEFPRIRPKSARSVHLSMCTNLASW